MPIDQTVPPPLRLEGSALFLDVDGTLLALAETPDAVKADGSLRALVHALSARLDGALALVSGRSLTDLDRIFAPLRLPAAGQHGLERRSHDERVWRVQPVTAYVSLLEEVAQACEAMPGVLVERKGITMALHYRQAPEWRDALTQLLGRLITPRPQLAWVMAGKMVFEIKPPGGDKGAAISAFMGETPWAGRMPVFLGDDLTDEAGFALVERREGLTVKVGAGPSVAHYRLADVEAARAWLAASLAAG
ncbi:trehalose-phosphatase [Niveibacterium sp. SC-1]|uniref:trehalose-phosphatase n=1 Tax=Niveibacterium sp. SC-1 TaxID=3135646 RepID=UPI00311E1B3B